METENTSEVAAFLRGFPPYESLPAEELAAVAEAVEVRRYAAGEKLLVEDARPSQHLFVVREGSVELVHEDEVVDVLEPGESFGHPSLLTGLAPAFTVRAHEDSTCFLIPREAAVVLRVRLIHDDEPHFAALFQKVEVSLQYEDMVFSQIIRVVRSWSAACTFWHRAGENDRTMFV